MKIHRYFRNIREEDVLWKKYGNLLSWNGDMFEEGASAESAGHLFVVAGDNGDCGETIDL